MPTLASLPVPAQVEPLRQWPRGYERTPEEERQSSPFEGAGILDRTLKDLKHELRQLEPESVVLQVDINPDAIRKSDGLPYANASLGKHDPGVVLTLEFGEGERAQTYPCDRFREWTENLRAITLALRSLRRVSRYGVGHGSEQYRGFTALVADVDERLGPDEAARIIVGTAGYRNDPDFEARVAQVRSWKEEAERHFREARKRSHPDSETGNAESFKRVNRAGEILRQHHESESRKELAR